MREPSTEDDLATALAVIRDLRLGYPWRELHLNTSELQDFYTRAVGRIEAEPATRAEDWACDLLIE